MSYCRFSSGKKTYLEGTEHEFTPEKSDVYVYEHYLGFLDCCGCRLNDGSYHTNSRSDMIGHLKEHITVGDTVPSHVIPTLEEEIAEEGDEILIDKEEIKQEVENLDKFLNE